MSVAGDGCYVNQAIEMKPGFVVILVDVIIYFDESYDRKHRYLLLGTLYVPASRRLNRRLTRLKAAHRAVAPAHTFTELKYSKTNDKYIAAASKHALDVFVSSSCFFRCIVVDTQLPGFSWGYFGGPSTTMALRKAYVYNKFAERLLRFNLGSVSGAVLLADSLTRTPGDNFVQYIGWSFGSTIDGSGHLQPAKLRHVQEVNTRLPQYQVGQIGDILLGVVLGDLVPPMNANKLGVIAYAKSVLQIPSFQPAYWRRYPKYLLDVRFPKFQVWHWQP